MSKVWMVRRTVVLADGESVSIPLVFASEKSLAETFQKEDRQRLAALGQGSVNTPLGAISFRDALAAIGISAIGNDIAEMPLKSSALVVPEIKLQ